MKVIVVVAWLLYIAPPSPVTFPFVNVIFMKVTFTLLPMVNILIFRPCASITILSVGPFPCIVTFLSIAKFVLLSPV
ncbi:hypothetical protein MBCUT_12010 [Methanobrevibacter cuticularis]|uniref:Uncharacterized protein n=1 Tax=Methanobrevibacter cuticularis TaxID=47311 RepID=A0A166DT58_9EURY|nr:hypothetical protein MBCUT_12010 [Methanobrevibacter cuticularis]